MKNLLFTTLFLLSGFLPALCQVGIKEDGSAPDPSAGLDVMFSDKGFLMPRLTTSQIYYIENPATGLIAFNLDSLDFWYFDGTRWMGLIDHTDTLNPAEWYCGIDVSYFGDLYRTIRIDTLCWMARNLNTTRYRTGDIIPNVTSGWDNLTTGARCYYNNDSASFAADYGALYNWYAVDRRTLCPTGWHVPSDAEWNGLSNYLGGGSVSGGKMKETGTVHWNSPNTGATNSSGFTGLPGGTRMIFGGYESHGFHGYWWTATPYNNNAWQYVLSFENEILLQSYYSKFAGNSVRCVKNNYANQPPYAPSDPIPYDHSVNQYPEISLSWTCSDFEGDSLIYDIYLDTLANPVALLISGIDSTDCTVSDPLFAGETYYWKVVVHDNSSNTTMGPVWNFSVTPESGISGGPCPIVPTVSYWGVSYNTVMIEKRCWFVENLKTSKYQNGDYIPNVTGSTGWTGLSEGARCYYSNDSATYNPVYGALYNSMAARDSRNLCPPDWHVPTDAEWTDMVDFLGGDQLAGGRMKETGTAHWTQNIGATNESNFTALPGGLRNYGNYERIGSEANWWSATASGDEVWYYTVAGDGPPSYRLLDYTGTAGISVRCIWDDTVNLAPMTPSDPDPEDDGTNKALTITLDWFCSDPENDPMTYDVYFGTDADPVDLAANDISDSFLDIPYLLDPDQTYYWTVKAFDDHGNSTEGPIWSFTTREWQCGDTLDYSSHAYPTVMIGTQCWMAENLDVGTQIPGTTYMSNNSNIEKHCYNDVADSCAIYGGLYEWNEMMNYTTTPGAQGICPTGWHVPSATEWDALSASLGGNTVAGGHLKATDTTYWKSPNTGADNSSGFSAFGGGTYRPAGYNYYYLIREGGIYWTSTPNGSWAYRRDMSYLNSELNPYTCERYHSFSVRCLKD